VVATTLVEIRERIGALASDDGDYYVVCGRTGDRPVPAAGKRFEGRATARSAARATEQYRSALRRYDPQVPYYDLIVCRDAERRVSGGRPRQCTRTTDHSTPSEPGRDDGPPQAARQQFVGCGHSVAAAGSTRSDDGDDAGDPAAADPALERAGTDADPDGRRPDPSESVAGDLDSTDHTGGATSSEV
jgi:hypothetical protein